MSDDPFNYSGKLAFLRRLCVDPRLQRAAVAVAVVLVDHANRRTGLSFPSVATIVAESHVPKSTALRALRRLEETGWITSVRRNGALSRYRLTGPDSETGPDVGTGATWASTGAIQNLRRGQTGPAVGAEAVPLSGHEQKVFKATGFEQRSQPRETRRTDLASRFEDANRPHDERDRAFRF